jgi:four helix bundle protein
MALASAVRRTGCMAGVRDHEELVVYQLCNEVRQRVRAIVRKPSFTGDFTLRDQLSDAAESPCPNIAEGFSRYYPRDNARFVRIAKASLTEVIVHTGSALAKGLIENFEHDEICSLSRRARKAATNYIRYLETARAPGTSQPKSRRPRTRQHLR